MKIKVECENCGKNIYMKEGYVIECGKVELDSDGAGFPNGSGYPEGLDAMFCSLKCIKEFLARDREPRKTLPEPTPTTLRPREGKG